MFGINMGRPRFWHEVAITLGGPIAMSIMSLALARLIEEGAGPVIPPITEPPAGALQEVSSPSAEVDDRLPGSHREAGKGERPSR